MDETYNHEISKILYSHLRNQRKITPENKAIVIELMDTKANKKLIQDKIMKESGKIVCSEVV
ncbi:zinc finger SWIM domain-containing protein 3 [Aphis craccivora]|uniref:Zinc finger SWIM domain-containing protein 3 n=1 Tax=Aphis craccivora TaxID=307492 RepID=A0A6G0Y586_APHCR|nr:zinc finger SWIM domain-containing protein 3 [Aphis craccivora]